MDDKFPMGEHWAAQLLAEVLPQSKVKNVQLAHRDSIAAQLVRSTWMRSDDLARIITRVKQAYRLLDAGFDEQPAQMARIVDDTFNRLEELQEREFSLARGIASATNDDLEAQFGEYLSLYRFTYEQYYRTLAAPYVVAHALTTSADADADTLVDDDGRAHWSKMQALDAALGLAGTMTEGLDNHLRNSAAHHRYSILSDDRIRLWDTNGKGRTRWGQVEWTRWQLGTNVYQLSNTCSALVLGLAVFDISHAPTIMARGWRTSGPPRRKRRDIVKSELMGMAQNHGFDVESVVVANDGSLEITLRVLGRTIPDQVTEILAGGGGPCARYNQKVATLLGHLRKQVYGFLQATLDAHGGYEVVRVRVVYSDGRTSRGQVGAAYSEREAMWRGKEDVEVIRQRVQSDTLAAIDIPVIIRGPLIRVR